MKNKEIQNPVEGARPEPAEGEKYNHYKDSGIKWIGEIPGHWGVKKIKYLTKVLTGSTPKSTNADYWNGKINWVTTDDLGKLETKFIFDTRRKITEDGFKNSGTHLAGENSIVLSTRAPIGHLGILRIEACSNQGCKTIESNSNFNSEFLYYYLFSSKEFLNSLGVGTTFLELPTQSLRNLSIHFPPIEEQREIATYLDRKTAEIDELIADKKRLIELYEEEKTAVINDLVTGKTVWNGASTSSAPGVWIKPTEVKDSGIEWLPAEASAQAELGKIPEDWEVKKLKYVVSKIGSGVTPKGGSTIYKQQGIPFLRSQNIHFDGLLLGDVAFITEEIHESMSNSKVFSGDILLNITGASIGRIFYVEDWLGEANVNQHVCIIRPTKFIETKYLYFVLRSFVGQEQIGLEQTGSGREGLNFEDLKQFEIPLPKIETQRRIVQKIETETARINAKKEKAEKLIALLTEYREALISEVVTGKVKVKVV